MIVVTLARQGYKPKYEHARFDWNDVRMVMYRIPKTATESKLTFQMGESKPSGDLFDALVDLLIED